MVKKKKERKKEGRKNERKKEKEIVIRVHNAFQLKKTIDSENKIK